MARVAEMTAEVNRFRDLFLPPQHPGLVVMSPAPIFLEIVAAEMVKINPRTDLEVNLNPISMETRMPISQAQSLIGKRNLTEKRKNIKRQWKRARASSKKRWPSRRRRKVSH
jgi:hypothetical protein